MHKQLFSAMKSLLKPLLIFCLVATLLFGQAGGAMAATGGGRIGGGSFRMPSRSYGTPSRTYTTPRGGYYPGGGVGFPFLVPIFGFGGGFGGLFTILIFISIASFLVRSFRNATEGDSLGYDTYSTSPSLSVARLQVGLLAEARSLQADLNRIANTANTGSSEGLAQVLQETTLSLLRHPEYWVYAGAETQMARLAAAEAQFNRLALAERSKFSEETLSNVNNQLKQAAAKASLAAAEGSAESDMMQAPGENIVVTLLVATKGKLQLPSINSSEDLRRALAQLGSVSSDQLVALEVLWTPQAEGDTLSAEDMLTQYADLKRL
jgi:uncharacterized membrane protein